MSADVTRRRLLAGAAAVPVLAAAASSPSRAAAPAPRASAIPVLRGRAIAVGARGRRIVVAHDARRTVAVPGRHEAIDVGGRPVAVAVRADGALAAVTTAAWDAPGLALVDPLAGRTRSRVAVGPAPGAVAFVPGGRRLVVAGGEQEGTVTQVDVERAEVVRSAQVGRVPRGLAVAPDGGHVYVALQADDRVVAVDLRTGRVRRTLRVAPLPEQLALDATGRRLLVTHLHEDDVTELDLRTGRSRRHVLGHRPSGVGWTGDGRPLALLAGAGQVADLRRRRRHDAGTAPRGLVVLGRRFWTVSALTGAVTRGRA